MSSYHGGDANNSSVRFSCHARFGLFEIKTQNIKRGIICSIFITKNNPRLEMTPLNFNGI